MYFNEDELKKIDKVREQRERRAKKWFMEKERNHLNSEKFRKFYELFKDIQYSEKLYEIKFKSSFSIYLYLYLKSQAKPYEVEGDGNFSISQPVEVNFGKIQRLSQLTKNTVKKAFWELVNMGLLLFSEDLKPKHHNSTKAVMVLNDQYLVGFDEKRNRIVYSIKSTT
jgi:hypothetical protein